MESMRSIHSHGAGTAVKPALAPSPTQRTISQTRRAAAEPAAPRLRRSGYGLPCAKCRKYYPAELNSCPVCKSAERVSPTAVVHSSAPLAPNAGSPRDEEKERILREFKAKLYASHTQINTTTQGCVHAGGLGEVHESPSVCKKCYEKLQARVDLLEAVLHMDLKEAAQIIYDAVWADTSDCNKTYQNAAQALLSELRKRAGLKIVLGRMQPLAH